jgi:hypothetical protein
VYGRGLGAPILGVPPLIGFNWALVCLGVLLWVAPWAEERNFPRPVIALAVALLATGFDWVMEPVAMTLGVLVMVRWRHSASELRRLVCHRLWGVAGVSLGERTGAEPSAGLPRSGPAPLFCGAPSRAGLSSGPESTSTFAADHPILTGIQFVHP